MRRFEDKRLRDAARDQPCTFRVVDVCCGDPATTVLCHDRRGLFAAGMKPDDFNAAHGCHTCHAVMDRKHKKPNGEWIGAEEAGFYWNRAKVETLANLFRRGILCVTDGDETKAGGTD